MAKLLSTQEAAEELGISLRAIQRMLADGRVDGARKISGVWVIPSPVKVKPGKRGPAGVAKRPRD